MGRSIAAALLALATGMLAGVPTHANMRVYTNVPIADFPKALRDAAGGHFFNEGYLNVKAAPYHARGDGTSDDSAAFVAAIRDAYANNLVVLVPIGTYLISRQLRLVQAQMGTVLGQRKFAHLIVGQKSASGRPVLKLKDGVALPGPFIEFVYERLDAATGKVVNEPMRQYNATFKGLAIDMGHNPTQTALSMDGAQYCVIEDVNIFGDFDTGIRQLPGSGGSTTNVEIAGGRIGILQDAYRPNPLVTGVRLTGQSLYGVRLLSSRGPLTMVGFHIESPASPVPGYRAISLTNTNPADPSEANLNLLDGDIVIHGPGRPAIENFDQDLYVRNVFIRSAIMIQSGSRKPPAEILKGSTAAFKHIGEYVFAGGTDNAHVNVDGRELAHSGKDVATVSGVTDDNPPGDLVSRHTWDSATVPAFQDAGVVNIVLDYGATPDNDADDDAVAIQRAIDDTTTPGGARAGQAVFIPRGHFQIRQPIRVHAGARIFGASNTISAIEVSTAWQPTAPTAAVVTDDRADSSVFLADVAILGHDPTPFKGLASHKYISFLILQTDHTLLRDVQLSVREYWRTDNVYQEPAVVFTGHAGGRFYNVVVDLEHKHATGAMSPGYRLMAFRGTTSQIQMYQPDTEYMNAGPQMEIAAAKNVFLYAWKYEQEHQLLRLRDSTNVGIFGGSGNYSLYEAGEPAMFVVSDSANYVLANMARKPDRANPRDQANATRFDVISNGVTRVPADRNNLALFKVGEISIAVDGAGRSH